MGDNYTFLNFKDTDLYKELKEKLTPPGLKLHDYDHSICDILRAREFFYESHILLEFYNDLPKEGLILDVGANVGNHQVMFNQLYPDRPIIGFEASPHNYVCLHSNTYNYKNTNNICIGLGSQKGISPYIHFISNMGGSGMINNNNTYLQEKYAKSVQAQQEPTYMDMEVIIEPLDLFNFDLDMTLMKVDVEGYELEVLKGATNTITKHRPMIWIEDFQYEKDRALSAIGYLEDNFKYKVINKNEKNYLLETKK